MDKNFLEQTLEGILNGLKEGLKDNYNSYKKLYPEEFEEIAQDDEDEDCEERYSLENGLAKQAISYPELHELMEQIVLQIIRHNENHKIIWENEEEQAGGCLARELAMYDKKYIPLYYRYIETNDLDHEVYQSYDMIAIFNKWDYSKEIFPILLYRGEHGQDSDMYEDMAKDICKTVEEADGYLIEAVKYFIDQWSFEEREEFGEPIDNRYENELVWLWECFTPVFAKLFNLDDDQMREFALRFNNLMAKNQVPTIADLIS